MNQLETMIRDTLVEEAAHAPSSEGLADAVHAADRRRRRARYAALGAAAAVCAGAVALSVVHSASTPLPGADNGGRWGRAIGYHGIVLNAPRGIPVRNACPPPVGSYVLAVDPDLASLCPAIESPVGRPGRPLRVVLGPGSYPAGPFTSPPLRLALQPTSVDGYRGSTGYGHLRGDSGTTGVLILPNPGVEVSVTAPDAGIVHRILDSVRVSAVDPRGCAQRIGKGRPQNSSASEIIPGSPVAAKVCDYVREHSGAQWLLGSRSVPRRLIPRLVQLIDGLPLDANYDFPPASDTKLPADVSRLVFRYADGATRTISVQRSTPSLVDDGHLRALDLRGRVTRLLGGVR